MPRASKNRPLQGWYVISLRPLGQHAGVRRSAAALGASVFALSTLRLQALAAGEALREAAHCTRVIATSPAAVRFAHAQSPLRPQRGQLWFAPGSGTAAALRRHGIAAPRRPDRGASSEALLDDPQLQDVRGARIGLLTAPGGRALIASELQRRGASLVVAEVYQRESRPPGAARLRALQALPDASALLCTSSEALGVLWQALDDAGRDRLRRRPCIASSERLAGQLAGLGFTTVRVADDARPQSLLASLASHVGQVRFR